MKKLLFFLISSFVLFSCVKQEFDDPPADGNSSNLIANKTIKDLKDIHKIPGAFDKITEDWIIEGIVVADDASGNYYKTIVIQDATGGIDVKLDATGLYNDFPIGRKIFIKCKDLVVSDYNGLTQLGGGTFKNNSGQDQLAGIEQLLIPSFIFKGEVNQKITPKEIKIAELSNDMLSTLVTLKDVQFGDDSRGVTYADAAKKLTLNRTIVDCDGISIVLRTSGYASFANEKTPELKGTITGVYSIFGTTKQFYIRDITDVKLNDPLCGGGGGTATEVAIGDLISGYKNGQTTAPANTKIVGTVISDKDGKNINGQNAIVQGNDNKGIIVRFSGTHGLAMGDLVEINVGNAVLSEYQKALQISVGSTSVAKKTGTNVITPNKMTLKQFNDNFDALESTLVQIDNATASTTSKFGGSINLTDASGASATLFTYNTSAFANDPLPSDVINVVGVASRFGSTLQIQMRNNKDATKGVGGSTGGGNEVLKSIAEIRSLFSGTATKAPADSYIKGIVISDKDGKNIPALNAVIQEPNGRGIVVRFNSAHSFALGDEVSVVISNQELSEFNGLLQINKVPNANAKKIGTGTITPAVKTIKEINDNFEQLESSLVLIKNVDIPAATKYGGTIKVSDGTSVIDLFTSFTGSTIATFVNNKPPTGTYSITAIVNQYKPSGSSTNGYQIQIRNESDIK